MNYREQERFLQGSRAWGAAVGAAFLAAAAFVRLSLHGRWRAEESVIFALAAIAAAVLTYYTPDYLHLSVTPERKRRWEIKFRWRVIAAILVLGLLFSPGGNGRVFTLFVAGALAAVNWLGGARFPQRNPAALFWITDCIFFFAALIRAGAGTAGIVLLLLAASAHMAVVRREDQHRRWIVIPLISGSAIAAFATAPFSRGALVAGMLLLVVSIAGTAWLVERARRQNERNVEAAMRELMEFTGYPAEKIWRLWATCNQELAKNWELAALPPHDQERMAEWYRKNSELYLFAISAYNQEYKRIRSNLKVLRWARGATLDYGAGNGEILLEVARRGQPAAYYDVEGETMRFARWRAQRLGLAMDFFSAKEALAEAARRRGFDTIFSFDVLEHLPDLPGELAFLASLLAPGGLFVFDVPAGSTKAHPMHLNHDLDVLACLGSKGLKDERGLMLRLPFRKEEKFVFRAPGGETG